jgi:hypothetical protein
VNDRQSVGDRNCCWLTVESHWLEHTALREAVFHSMEWGLLIVTRWQATLLSALSAPTDRIHEVHLVIAEFKKGLLHMYEGVSKSYRTRRLEREPQMAQFSATRCSCIAILWISLVRFAAITLYIASQGLFIVVKSIFRYRLSPETFGYTLVAESFFRS